jgi:hypothetical protein
LMKSTICAVVVSATDDASTYLVSGIKRTIRWRICYSCPSGNPGAHLKLTIITRQQKCSYTFSKFFPPITFTYTGDRLIYGRMTGRINHHDRIQ